MAPPPPNSGNVTSGVCPAPRRQPGTAGRLWLGLWSGGGRAAPGGYCAAPPLQAFTHRVSGSRTAQGTRGGKADCRQEPGSDRGRAAAPGRGEASPPPGCGKGGGRASSWAPPPSGTTPGFVKLLQWVRYSITSMVTSPFHSNVSYKLKTSGYIDITGVFSVQSANLH